MSPLQRVSSARIILGFVALLLVASVGSVVASPAPVSACPPCSDGFVYAAQSHGLETDVERSEATVMVHENGSATWTVRVVPTNETVLDRLAENATLARSVASESFGVRYGDGIEHDLRSATVEDGAFVIRYRTLDVVDDGPLGSTVLTYFRDSPGAWIYTDLGADRLTVVAPEGTTVARGFGEIDGRRMTATEFPDTRDGPFVVFVPEGSALPGVRGSLAVLAALGGVVVRNLLWFVALPGSVLLGGLAAIRRAVDPDADRNATRWAGLVAAGGLLLVAGTLVSESHALPSVTRYLVVGVVTGLGLVAFGLVTTRPWFRDTVTVGQLVGGGVVAAVALVAVARPVFGLNRYLTGLSACVGLFPVAVALGRADAAGDDRTARRLFAGLAVTVVVGLGLLAPLTSLGGTLFIVAPVLLTLAALGVVVAWVPLYVLGAASVTESSR